MEGVQGTACAWGDELERGGGNPVWGESASLEGRQEDSEPLGQRRHSAGVRQVLCCPSQSEGRPQSPAFGSVIAPTSTYG